MGSDESDPGTPTVLIAEDDPLSLDMLARRIERKGMRVLRAADGAEAVRVAVDELPDLILMDLSMPGVDGWEAMQWLRDDDATAHIPVFAITAHEFEGMRAAARGAGFADFESKPIDLPRLLEKMRAHLRRQR
jgi:two-component system cell cycle response regulator DivK